jgi:iron(III) transport system substrate-binding protein
MKANAAFYKSNDAFISISGGGVLKTSKHKKEALAFLKWVTGKGGQDVLKKGDSFEYAVGNGAGSNPSLPPLADLHAPRVEPSNLGNKAVTDMMTDIGSL